MVPRINHLKAYRKWKPALGYRRRVLSSWLPLVVLAALGAGTMSGGNQQALTFVQSGHAQSALIGRASVIDGDTIEIRGERIRFNGIDAPESRQACKDAAGRNYRCGAVAANALAKFLAGSSPTRCEFVDRDRYGRFVGDCYRADGSSVAAWLVRNGHALDWPRYSGGRFAPEQRTARLQRAGIWQGTFESPWEWRARR